MTRTQISVVRTTRVDQDVRWIGICLVLLWAIQIGTLLGM